MTTDRDRFEFRLGLNDRDISHHLRRYSRREGSASQLIKELLRAYFSGDLDRFNQPGEPSATDEIDRRKVKALAKLKSLTFDELEE
jgi:hypothetical protein